MIRPYLGWFQPGINRIMPALISKSTIGLLYVV